MARHHRPRGNYRANMRRLLPRRSLLVAVSILVGLFVVGNAALWVTYHNRTYPRTKIVNNTIGSVTFDELANKADQLKLPNTIQLSHDEQKATIKLSSLGGRQDGNRTVENAKAQRSWLPVVNLFKSPQLKAPVTFDRATLQTQADELAKRFHREPVTAHLQISGDKVVIAKARDGYSLDKSKLEQSILDSLDNGQTTISVAVNTSKASTSDSLPSVQASLQQQIDTSISFKYGNKSKQASAQDVARWFTPSGNTYGLASDKVQAYVAAVGTEFGIHIKDSAGVVRGVMNAVDLHKNSDFTLTKQVALKTYYYCTALKGVDASNMASLRNQLASTYNDPRGWNADGLIGFEPATSNCDFTVWLVAPDLMTTFGSICDPVWNCEPGGDNVVLNYARWTSTTDPWKAVYPDGNLYEYRSMAINHETGHQLGFGHQVCTPAMAGQPSPVMQQESIDLHGCTFNAWPLPSEVAALKSHLGL